MSLRGEQTHHHSLLAGVGAGTAGVLVVLVLLLLAWHRIAGAVGAAASVIIWAVAAMVIAAAVYGVVFLALRLRLHAQRPETLTRYTARAGTPASPQVLPSQPVTELGAGGTVIHNHFDSPEATAAALRALRGPPDAPR